MEYIVKTKRSPGSAFTGELFRSSVVEYINGDEETETYSVTSERDLERIMDMSADVIGYTVA